MASSDPSRRDPAVAGKVLLKKEKQSGPIKLKKSIAKNTKPKDSGKLKFTLLHAETRSPSPDSPSVNGNDTESRASLPASQTGEDTTQRVRCKHCKEPVAKALMGSHTKTCPAKKNNKDKLPKKKESRDPLAKPAASTNDKDGELLDDGLIAGRANGADVNAAAETISSAKGVIKSGKKTAVKDPTNNSSKKTKKRKAELEGDKEPKKKKLKKDEPPKPKLPKPKGPVDVEKQCGVPLPNGGYCARSLTCKSHSMGAKRAVPGRSKPYDTLLNQYQKKNQAKQQKAAMDANAALVDDIDANVPVDSDEEKDAVMAGLARWRPQPLAQHVFTGCRPKYNRIRIKEALAQALAGQRGSNMFAVRPPEVSSGVATGASQMAPGVAAVNGEGGDGGPTMVDLATSGGIGLPNGGSQSEGGNSGVSPSERRPSGVQQALGGNAGANPAGESAGGARTGGAAEGSARKASVVASAA
ncbi:MAG: hypothetical protein Q9209_000404 [Squamulea sp. 1 TL-2023]